MRPSASTAPAQLAARPWPSGLAFPEGLRWHAGRLWFSDMLGGAVDRGTPATSNRPGFRPSRAEGWIDLAEAPVPAAGY